MVLDFQRPTRRVAAGAGVRRGPVLAVAIAAVAYGVGPTVAADFYKDKTVTIVISTGVGGNDDLITKGLVRHMPSHLPGHPNMIAQNMPGAGNVLATNF